MKTLHPTQIGYTDTGYAGGSQLIIGRSGANFSNEVDAITFEALGFGKNGRPDYLENFQINWTKINLTDNTKTHLCQLNLNVNDLFSMFYQTNGSPIAAVGAGVGQRATALPTKFEIKFTGVSICQTQPDGSTLEKEMLIFGSQPYDIIKTA